MEKRIKGFIDNQAFVEEGKVCFYTKEVKYVIGSKVVADFPHFGIHTLEATNGYTEVEYRLAGMTFYDDGHLQVTYNLKVVTESYTE